jgi:hypothetical protein
VLTASDSHTTELFQPGVEVIKTGPASASVGETITYNFVINNLSSADSPDLVLDSVTDTVLGDLTATAVANGCDPLASPGGTCAFTFDYTIQAGDPNPLVNVVTVHYHPDGFPNDITDDDDHSLEILAGEGCTPGWWKNNGLEAWDESTDPLAQAVATAVFDKWGTVVDGTTDSLFREVFNLTAEQMTAAGLDPDLTLLEGVSLGGGDFNALARHGVSALLNSLSVSYGISAESILQDMHDAYADEVWNDQALLDTYSAANEQDHSSCPEGGDTGSSTASDVIFLSAVLPTTLRWLRKEKLA